MQNKKKLKIGIIGLGKMGKNYFNILTTLNTVEITLINDSKKKFNSNYHFSNVLSKKQLKLIDAAIISAPTPTHFNLIRKIGKHVKNILVEKPMTQNFTETKKIISYAKKNKLNLKVGFIERFNPVTEHILNIVKKERIIFLDLLRVGFVPSKDIDVVSDLMVHDVDLSIFFSGKIKKVKSYNTKDGNYISHSTAFLTHQNGNITRLLASRINQKKIRKINVTLKNKYIEANLLKKEIIIYKNLKIKDTYKTIFKSITEEIETKPKEALLSQINAFIESCHGIKNKYLSDYKENYEVMRVCEKIKKSI